MLEAKIQCPSCEASEHEQIEPFARRCRVCGTLYRLPSPPNFAPAPMRPQGDPLADIGQAAFGLVIALVIVGVVGVILLLRLR
jgi:hypothetical protein